VRGIAGIARDRSGNAAGSGDSAAVLFQGGLLFRFAHAHGFLPDSARSRCDSGDSARFSAATGQDEVRKAMPIDYFRYYDIKKLGMKSADLRSYYDEGKLHRKTRFRAQVKIAAFIHIEL
jgi:hypothetical protein